uniref:Uncharacterized protein n=1 Tax=Neobodo designis TaxID=312471 RepID=A0A7S1MMU3_NEODS
MYEYAATVTTDPNKAIRALMLKMPVPSSWFEGMAEVDDVGQVKAFATAEVRAGKAREGVGAVQHRLLQRLLPNAAVVGAFLCVGLNQLPGDLLERLHRRRLGAALVHVAPQRERVPPVRQDLALMAEEEEPAEGEGLT